MNEIVKYDNRMNWLKFKGLTKMDMNLLLTLCSQMKNKGTEEITLSFNKIKELSNYTSTDTNDFLKALDDMIFRLQKVNSKIITNGEICYFVLFPTFRVNTETETVKIAVNKDFVFLLNDLKEFTRFELTEFIELDSKYTKNLYRLLKQFRTTGKLVINDVEDFKEKLDSPKSYKVKDFKRFVLDVAVKELQDKELFKNLTYKPKIAKKRGSPIIGYEFTFDAEQVHKKTESNTEPKTPIKTKTTKKPVPMTKSAENYLNYPQRQYTKEELENLEIQLLQIARI